MMSETIEGDNKKKKAGFNLWVFVGVAVVVIAAWFGYWEWIISCFEEWESRGQFGDMFGGLNALFSGLAFAGVICTILLQSNELALQREEMARFANAQEKSEKALSAQVDSMKVAARLNVISAQIQVECEKGQTYSLPRGTITKIDALVKEAKEVLTQPDV